MTLLRTCDGVRVRTGDVIWLYGGTPMAVTGALSERGQILSRGYSTRRLALEAEIAATKDHLHLLELEVATELGGREAVLRKLLGGRG
jgi:hypothetical protein